MDQSMMVPLGLLAVIGGVLSHIIATRRLKRLRRELLGMHIRSLTMMGDSAMEIMCVDHEMEIEAAHARLQEAVAERGGDIMIAPLRPESIRVAKAMITVKRAERSLKLKGAADGESKEA